MRIAGASMKIIQAYIKNIFPLLLFCIISVFVFTSCEEDTVQPETYGSISGSVYDADDIKTPVSGASVTTNPPTSALLTDSNGKFKVSNIPVGSYVITVSKSGYDKGTISVSVKEGETSEASVLLTQSDTENNAPYAPVNYLPADEAENQPVAVTLKWSGRDPDANDSLRYDVYLYETSSASKKLLAADIADTTYQVSGLKYNTAYFWQIIIKDNSDASVNGDVWGFKTKPMPDNRILFVSNVDGDYDVYSTNLDDTVALQLTTNSVRDWQPRYNKDRKKIAFASDYNGDMQLYVMNYDGTGINKITSLPIAGYHNSGYGFCWAPSGDKPVSYTQITQQTKYK
jgi:TolB protein